MKLRFKRKDAEGAKKKDKRKIKFFLCDPSGERLPMFQDFTDKIFLEHSHFFIRERAGAQSEN